MMPQFFALFGLYLLAAGAGVSFIFQQAVNSNLRAEIGSPWWAGFISYLGGTLAMFVMVVALREPWLSASAIARSSWMSWTGGIFGAIYIAISILLLPRLGAAVVVALIVVGQMIGALVFDHFGLLGVPETPASPIRVAGAVLLIAGAVLIRI
jgi:bacterial/archaeal transporter family-2 protein